MPTPIVGYKSISFTSDYKPSLTGVITEINNLKFGGYSEKFIQHCRAVVNLVRKNLADTENDLAFRGIAFDSMWINHGKLTLHFDKLTIAYWVTELSYACEVNPEDLPAAWKLLP